ncbi:hypothetical protein KXD40_000872 [Peronospora effusa]|uniref:Uncharacterized protein n=1 Tax=Peronospora effusa TaxID=542832 RepID=A0A3M6VPN7_9STRA|nr:hypothetical protein DD238_003580 [Peronospora effusa]RQM10459.1 hypothetical protein DD237_003928 [Peronospora effusa]UIZ20601.1 hypothetical protein KXD40_000872 [Peronospora effusa]
MTVLTVSCTIPRCAAVEATACAQICYTTELTGFGPGGIPGCSCTGSDAGARTGKGDCNCGQCYTKSQGTVYGYAINPDGTCTYGTNCGSCDYSSSSSISTSSTLVTSTPSLSPTPSPVPATLEPSITSGNMRSSKRYSLFQTNSSSLDSTSSSSSASTLSNAASTLSNTTLSSTVDSNSTSDTASIDTISSDKSDETTDSLADSNTIDIGLHTWQIILAICCGVLVLVVAVVSVCSCYCKVRNRLNEHEEAQTGYYNQQAHGVPPKATNRSILTAASCIKSPTIV